MKKILSVCLFLLFLSSPLFAGQKTLTFKWQHNKVDLAGFLLYMSETSGDYTKGDPAAIDIPYIGQTDLESDQVIVSPDGEIHTYYFVLTAYDETGNESGFSNEVSAEIDFEAPSDPFNLILIIQTE